MQHFISRHNVV